MKSQFTSGADSQVHHPLVWLGEVRATGTQPVLPTDPDIHGAFRGVFELSAPATVEIRLLAAHWFMAWIDGEFLTEGPARFHPDHPEYEIITLPLAAGRHLLAVHAHCQGVPTQTLLADKIPPFVMATVQRDGVDVPLSWRATHLDAWRRTELRRSGLHGWFEDVELAKLPRGWQRPGFDDTQWHTPVPVEPFWQSIRPLDLAPIRQKMITPMPLAEGLLSGSFAAFREDVPITFFTRDQDPSDSMATGRWWRFDLGRVRLGRPLLKMRAPAGTVVEIGISETLQHGRVLPWVPLSLSATAWVDRFTTAEAMEQMEPLVPRGGRYVEIHAQAPPDQLELLDFHFVERGCFEKTSASLSSGDDQLDRIWLAGVDTLRACSEDAIVDTPVRERGQWTGDTLSVGLELVTTLYDDPRLLLRAMRQIAQCAREDGIVASLTPGANRIFFLSYACTWQEAAWTCYQRTGRQDHLHELLDAARANLAFFEKLFTPDGLNIGREITFIDWGYLPPEGEPDFATHLFLRRAICNSIEWFDHVNSTADAQQARQFLARLDDWLRPELDRRTHTQLGYHVVALSLREGLLDSERSTEAIPYLKQHILSCFPNDPAAPRLRSPSVNHPRIFTPYFAHFVFQQFIAAGEMDFVLDQIRHCWGWSLSDGRATITEVFDEHWSLCHHWSACPTWILSHHLLGLRPAFHLGRGHYELVLQPGSRPGASGSLPGGISISWHRNGHGIQWQCKTTEPIMIHDTTGRLPTSPLKVTDRASIEIRI